MNSVKSYSFGYLSFDSFWATNNYYKQKSVCVCLVTLIIIFAIGGLLVYQLINCISHKTVFSNSSITYSSEPPNTIITSDSSANDSSYMLGLSVLSNNCSAIATITLDVSYAIKTVSSSGGASSITETPLVLETCTSQHFKLLPGALSKISQWTTNSLKCLPLNRSFTFGGSTAVSGTERYIQYRFTCPPSCSGSCGTVQIFSQNTNVNPFNIDNIYNHYLQRKSFIIQNPTTYEYAYHLDQSIVSTDATVIFSKNHDTVSLAAGEFYNDILTSNSSTTILTIRRSDKTIYYKRTYLKLLDVLAYIGGLIQTIFVLFFFMPGFARMIFEMNFAKNILKNKEAKHFNFFTYLKQNIYSLLEKTPLQLDWKQQQKRQQASQAVSKLMNTIYLNKRISFLEEAISILLESHQLKGIHLIQHLNEQKVNQAYQSFSFRDRVIFFLSKYKRIVESNLKPNEQKNMINLSEKYLKGGQLNKMQEEEPIGYSGKTSSLYSLSKNLQREGIINQAELDEFKDNGGYSEQERLDQERLRQEMHMIGTMTDQQLDENRLVEEMQTELGRLLEEGERAQGGDQRSKRICERLQGWLKIGLKMTTRQQKKLQNDSHIQITFKKKI